MPRLSIRSLKCRAHRSYFLQIKSNAIHLSLFFGVDRFFALFASSKKLLVAFLKNERANCSFHSLSKGLSSESILVALFSKSVGANCSFCKERKRKLLLVAVFTKSKWAHSLFAKSERQNCSFLLFGTEGKRELRSADLFANCERDNCFSLLFL